MRTLIVGGAASGKSVLAEKLLLASPGPHHYVATLRGCDAECRSKIEKHRNRRRNTDIDTVECPTDIGRLCFEDYGTVLLECLTTLAANEMFDSTGQVSDPSDKILEGIEHLARHSAELIVVSNTVGEDLPISLSDMTLLYVRLLGRLNCELAGRFDKVYEMHCGSAIQIK